MMTATERWLFGIQSMDSESEDYWMDAVATLKDIRASNIVPRVRTTKRLDIGIAEYYARRSARREEKNLAR